ncbi:MAG: hypothetical protein AAF990_25615 [Bacteroidota bacterium]
MEQMDEKVTGLCFVAPPEPFPQNPMPAVHQIGAKWIAVIPFGFSRAQSTKISYNPKGWGQWWGERPEGIETTIKMAQKEQLNVMLKPQVYIPGSWPGGLDFAEEAQWKEWENSYEAYILPFADMAERYELPLFCIGTEFKISVQKREVFWRELIQKIRKRYSGKLVYAANWDEYNLVPFWDALDYIGVDAYFPLSSDQTPSTKSLIKAWKPKLLELRKFYLKKWKPILFTEFGYLSVDGCAGKAWELEKKINSLPVNEQAQANALDALFQTFWKEPFWAGGFLWKWFPNMRGHEGYPAKDYTPQGKISAKVVQNWYKKQ